MCRLVLFALLLNVTALGFSLSRAEAREFVDFTSASTLEVSEITVEMVRIEGSALLHIEKFNGLGVVGGHSDKKIDPGESIALFFVQPVSNLDTYKTCLSNDANNDGTRLKLRLEAYDASNQLLRRMEISPHNCHINYSDVLGISSVSRLVITMLSDSMTIGGFSFDIADNRKTHRNSVENFSTPSKARDNAQTVLRRKRLVSLYGE